MSVITVRQFAERVFKAIHAVGPPDLRNYETNDRGDHLQEEDIRRAFNYHHGDPNGIVRGDLGLKVRRGFGIEPRVYIKLTECEAPRSSLYFVLKQDEDEDSEREYATHYQVECEMNSSTTGRTLTETRAFIKALTDICEVGEAIVAACGIVVVDKEADLAADQEDSRYTKFTAEALSQMPVETMLITNDGSRIFKYQAFDDDPAGPEWRTDHYDYDRELSGQTVADAEFLARVILS